MVTDRGFKTVVKPARAVSAVVVMYVGQVCGVLQEQLDGLCLPSRLRDRRDRPHPRDEVAA